jgi:hypothetical protein
LRIPFAGFICSSLDIFEALRRADTKISPPKFLGGVSEVYPGHIWTNLGGGHRLPRKSTREGCQARKIILETLGVANLPELPTHDQNDACVAAVLAAAADGAVPGITATGIGSPLLFSDTDRTLREGLMVIPEANANTRRLIFEALHETPVVDLAAPNADAASTMAPVTTEDRAKRLLDWFITMALEGNFRYAHTRGRTGTSSMPRMTSGHKHTLTKLSKLLSGHLSGNCPYWGLFVWTLSL